MKLLLKNLAMATPPSLSALCSSRLPSLHRLLSSARLDNVISPLYSTGAGVADADDLDFDAKRKVMPHVVSQPLQPGVVIYDGVCHLCHRGVKWVINADKDKKIKFCCLQSKAAEPYLDVCGVDREDVMRRFIFVEGFGQYHQASTAALKVLSHLPFPYSTMSSLLIVPTPLRDVVYDFVAERRYNWFGKEEDCLVLKEPELLERFIDADEIWKRRRSYGI